MAAVITIGDKHEIPPLFSGYSGYSDPGGSGSGSSGAPITQDEPNPLEASTNTEGSSNVFVNSKGVHRVGDVDIHGGIQVTGSSDTFFNLKGVARKGDVNSGSYHEPTTKEVDGSSNTFVNGEVNISLPKITSGDTIITTIGDYQYIAASGMPPYEWSVEVINL